ncbi:unnamed protein product, partial [Discosporangium mesarthrocarpum]
GKAESAILSIIGNMEFDRNAISSLEDLQREWEGLEKEKAEVETRLRNFDGGRGGWRGGRGGGYGGAGRGAGPSSGRGNYGWGRGHVDDTVDAGTEREQPVDPVEREEQERQERRAALQKHRAMNGKWERGLVDP